MKRVSIRIDTLVKAERYRISRTMANIESVTNNLKESNEKITNILDNVSQISDSLSRVDFIGTVAKAQSSLEEVNMILYDVQNGDGTLTHLIQDSTMYFQINEMLEESTRLVENIKTHPNRYLQFSIFGSRDRSLLDARDERMLKKFATDSLHQ